MAYDPGTLTSSANQWERVSEIQSIKESMPCFILVFGARSWDARKMKRHRN